MAFCCRSARTSTRPTRRREESDGGVGAGVPFSIPRPGSSDGPAAGAEGLLNPLRSLAACGVGINFRVADTGDLEVESIAKLGPAERTGKIKIGDQLTRVDGRFIRGLPVSRVAPMVLGPAGTLVELSFKRVQGPAVMTINVALVREPPTELPADCAGVPAQITGQQITSDVLCGPHNTTCREGGPPGAAVQGVRGGARSDRERADDASAASTIAAEFQGSSRAVTSESCYASCTSEEVHRTLLELAAVSEILLSPVRRLHHSELGSHVQVSSSPIKGRAAGASKRAERIES
jgi:hypothetical protein